jgi:hypothetical protein
MRITGWVRPWMPATAAVASVLCLVAPWVRTGRVDRSTIDLLSSASALDVLEGRNEVIALSAWYLLPLLAAGAAVSAGWQRRRLTAGFALPIGPLMILAWWAVAMSPFDTRWGSWLGATVGLTATLLAALVLMGPENSAEGHG